MAHAGLSKYCFVKNERKITHNDVLAIVSTKKLRAP